MNNTTESVSLTGFVQSLPKSSKSETIRVVLVTPGGEEYPVLHKGAGVDLVDHIGADVEVSAVYENTFLAEYAKALRIRTYRVTDGYEDPWYDDEDA